MTTITNNQSGADFDRLMTLQEVAELLRVSKTTIYKLMTDGRLPTVRIGSRRFVSPSDYAALLASSREERPYDR